MLLKFLRKRKNMKRIMWALAILIIPAFVIWGSGTSGKKKDKGPDYAGKIFNKIVSFEEYLDMWAVTRDYLVRSFGANMPIEFIDQMAWNRIILLEASKMENIQVSDKEVAQTISSFPAFQRDGHFDQKLYKSMLADAARGFEERVRDDIRISKLREKITTSVSVSEDEIKDEYKKRFEKIKSSYISIPFSDYEKDVRYNESNLIKFFEKNKNEFRKLEEMDVRYIEIPFSMFENQVYIGEDDIKVYFEEHILDFKKPDSQENPVLDEAVKKDISEKLGLQRKTSLAEETAYKALDTALDKKNLEEAAKSFGLQDKNTGFFNMQQEIPGIGWSYEFAKQGLELEPGQISKTLIKTDGAFYIIQLKEKTSSFIPDFSQVKDVVVNSYIKNKSEIYALKNANKAYSRIKNKMRPGASFEDAASQLKKEIKKIDFTTRNEYIPTLGPAGDLVEACAKLEPGQVSIPVMTMESWVIPKLNEYQGIDEVRFVEEKGAFKENILAIKKQVLFDKWFEDFKKKADFISYTLK